MLSGGYDSVAAFELVLRTRRALGLFADYGQPYVKQEHRAVQAVARHYAAHPNYLGVRVVRLSLDTCNRPVAEYVPLRNLALAAVAANVAQAIGAEEVASGSKTVALRPEDPYSFRDSSVGFFDLLQRAVDFASEPALVTPRFVMPVAGMTKAEVLRIVADAGLDPGALWSCYRNGPQPCGECYHCADVRKALDAAGFSG